MQLVVGRIGRTHGVRGEVLVEVRTDDPDARFVPGSVLATEPAEAGPLTVRAARAYAGRLVVAFDGVHDRDAADRLRGTLLVIDSALLPPIDDPDEFHDHELTGLHAETAAGEALGLVEDILHNPGGDLLVVRAPDGGTLLVPFVRTIVPVVDVRDGRLVIDPPAGLLEL